jgi:hypothetical protein
VSRVLEFSWMYTFAGVVSLLAVVVFAIGCRMGECPPLQESL